MTGEDLLVDLKVQSAESGALHDGLEFGSYQVNPGTEVVDLQDRRNPLDGNRFSSTEDSSQPAAASGEG
jgi:hypothetical protein